MLHNYLARRNRLYHSICFFSAFLSYEFGSSPFMSRIRFVSHGINLFIFIFFARILSQMKVLTSNNKIKNVFLNLKSGANWFQCQG